MTALRLVYGTIHAVVYGRGSFHYVVLVNTLCCGKMVSSRKVTSPRVFVVAAQAVSYADMASYYRRKLLVRRCPDSRLTVG